MPWEQVGPAGYFHLLMKLLPEIDAQAEWALAAGGALLQGDGDPWPQVHAYVAHAASVGRFLEVLPTRRKSVAASMPKRDEMLRAFLGLPTPYVEVKAIRDGIEHIDERLEARLLQLADEPARQAALVVRHASAPSAAPDRMLSWEPSRVKISFTNLAGDGVDVVNVAQMQVMLSIVRQRIEALPDRLSKLEAVGGGPIYPPAPE